MSQVKKANDQEEVSVNLKKLDYSPTLNPYAEGSSFRTKKKIVRAGRKEDLVNVSTGEVVGYAAVHTTEEKDDAEFVKVFAAGVAQAFELSKTGHRVFQAILVEYERSPMRNGFADTVDLFWFGDGLNGRSLDMSEKTFQRGLKELLIKGFLAPKSPSVYWTNPALIFKGDRVAFVKEYRRRETAARVEAARDITDAALVTSDNGRE